VAGAAYLAAMIKAERSKNPTGTVLLSAGDMFQGTCESNGCQGAPVIEMMNELKFDAMALGNHEFDWGMTVFNRMRKKAAFPFLAANIVNKKEMPLPGIRSHRIVQRNKVKVAVIGIATPDTKYTTKPDNVKDLDFLKPELVLPRLIKTVRDQGASVVIVLSHLGERDDKLLASAVPGIDVIVGGHSHTAISKPLEPGNGTIIVQAGYNGLYLGVLELLIDAQTGRATGFTDRSGLKRVSAGPEDKTDRKTALLIKPCVDKTKRELDKPVGDTCVNLVTSLKEETNFGNLITDAMREASGAQIAVHNSGGIRTKISEGKITRRDACNAFPYDNHLVIMDLTAAELKELLNQSGKDVKEKGIMQLSGVKVTYDRSKLPGDPYVKATVDGEDLDKKKNKTYRVVTNDFLAAGGDYIDVFRKAIEQGRSIENGDKLRDVFEQYLKKHSPVKPEVEERIVFVNSGK
jgi:2',3'-cyclic-nucleotide 2'-phosphodiesterase (5'-nucleotidase family)